MKTFQEVLEKRVSKSGKLELDRHTIEKATRDIIEKMFGKLGLQNIKVRTWNEGTLAVCCERSAWRSEVMLNKERMIDEINSKCGSSVIADLRVRD